ncbi:GNAT family N-acetyltransferase [Halanaerobacter jeridensis]|uniref:RimJ/RimL family protein N-acetyltransferase n=1 Tax=Halanaerobacter jeridensis TaxID=706427 RepID=A0A938XTX5_9FIRM|nr:GNAT family protein [Halanaerobacter jeridensis]MBM7557455.1 RimJ/RimL family protein N-acetyltransferase [Halanaerobacter jeridensis]
MIKGSKVGLRAIEKNDLPKLMYWRNKPEFRKYFREYREINSTMQNEWFSMINDDDSIIMFAIIKLDTESLIGCCGLTYIDWVNRNADLSLYIGYDDLYIDKQGYARETCDLLLNYGFNNLDLHKVWTEIYEYDHKKKELYFDIGFQQDGALRDNNYYDGQWWDSLMLSILETEF